MAVEVVVAGAQKGMTFLVEAAPRTQRLRVAGSMCALKKV